MAGTDVEKTGIGAAGERAGTGPGPEADSLRRRILSVTRVRVRRIRDVPRFAGGFRACVVQLREHPDLMAALWRFEPPRVFWTASLWPSMIAMASYRNRNPHRTWMGHVEELCNESAYLHRPAVSDTLPAWEDLVREFRDAAHFTIMDPPGGVTRAQSQHWIPHPGPGLTRHIRPDR